MSFWPNCHNRLHCHFHNCGTSNDVNFITTMTFMIQRIQLTNRHSNLFLIQLLISYWSVVKNHECICMFPSHGSHQEMWRSYGKLKLIIKTKNINESKHHMRNMSNSKVKSVWVNKVIRRKAHTQAFRMSTKMSTCLFSNYMSLQASFHTSYKPNAFCHCIERKVWLPPIPWHLWHRFQIITCRLFNTKPLPEIILTCCQLDP